MTTIDATVARLMAQAWDIAINPDGFEAALRAALTKAQPVQTAPMVMAALTRLKFFRDLNGDERFKVLRVFGAVPDGVTIDDMSHLIEGRLFDKTFTAPKAQPVPPHECKTDAEKIAYAAGWWKALESVRGDVQLAAVGAVKLPRCDSADADAFIEKHLAIRNYPSNSKNAARAGWEAALDLFAAIAPKGAP